LGVRETGRKYGIPPTTISTWRKNGIEDKRNNCGRKCALGKEEEDELNKYFLDLREKKQIVTEKHLRAKIMQKKHPGFNASHGWFVNFKKRYRITHRTSSISTGQINPKEVDEFFSEIEKSKLEYELSEIWNLDQVPVFYENIKKTTLEKKGVKTVKIKTGGGHKKRATAIFCVSASGIKMPPYIIFKGVKLENVLKKLKLPVGFGAFSNEKGWCTEDALKNYYDVIFSKHCKEKKKNLFIFDSFFSTQKKKEIKDFFKNQTQKL